MHTFQATGGSRFHHNGDFSGDVHIAVHNPGNEGAPTVEIPMVDLLEFVNHYQNTLEMRPIEDLNLTPTLLDYYVAGRAALRKGSE